MRLGGDGHGDQLAGIDRRVCNRFVAASEDDGFDDGVIGIVCALAVARECERQYAENNDEQNGASYIPHRNTRYPPSNFPELSLLYSTEYAWAVINASPVAIGKEFDEIGVGFAV